MPQAARAAVQAPSIELGEFQLAVHRRQFPDAQDRWDGNWLCVTAQCAQAGAIVAAGGPILEATDLLRFREQLDDLRRGDAAIATLAGAEPHVRVEVARIAERGHLRLRIELSPDPQSQGHWFVSVLDRAYLAAAIDEIDAVLAIFPVRGAPVSPVADLDDDAPAQATRGAERDIERLKVVRSF